MNLRARYRVAACSCLVSLAMTNCVTRPGSNQGWGTRLLDSAVKRSTVREISSFLGAEPVKCESLPSYPVVGLLIVDRAGPTVDSVDPAGPSARSGIGKGDKILFINSKPVETVEQGSELIRSEAGPGRQIVIETQRGTYRFTPRYPKTVTQCYWDVKVNQVRNNAGGLNSTENLGQASEKEAAHPRSFVGTCRFFDGRASQCQYIWQE